MCIGKKWIERKIHIERRERIEKTYGEHTVISDRMT